MTVNVNLSQFHWQNQPAESKITGDTLILTTEPLTDFWQHTYYGFQHDNAHAFLMPVAEKEFSFSVKAVWKPNRLFDQCGVILYQNADNWFKASVEYENEEYSRLGSVVTNLGYSDWATTDIDSTRQEMYYRLSRRGQDFLIENSSDGGQFKQMRIFHIHQPMEDAYIGVYACSPLNSSMPVEFSSFLLGECCWDTYANPDGD